MKLLGFVATACIALALLRVALTVLLIVLLLGLVASFIYRPLETCAVVAFLVLTDLLQAHPLGFLIGLIILLIVGRVLRD